MGRIFFGGFIVLCTLISVAVTKEYIAVGQQTSEQPQKATTRGNDMTDLTRQELLQRAVPLGAPVHTTLEQPDTVVERVATPFFSTGSIYKVSTRPPERPRTYILGVWGNDEIKVLNGDPKGFFDLAAKSGLKLGSDHDHVAYVTTFLDATRDFTGGVQVLSSIEGAWWLPKPTPAETERRAVLIEKYASVIKPPHMSREADPSVTVYVIRDRALLKLQAKVESDGRIDFSEKVLEAEMPTVMLR